LKTFAPNPLPSVSSQPGEPVASLSPGESTLPEGKTLLVVEDEEALRELEMDILGGAGFHVLQSGCVEEAMRLAAAPGAIHLLLTDFSLPDRNGLELARRFRQLHPQAAIIMVSGSAVEPEGKAHGLERFAVMEKPFRFNELLRVVGEMLADTAPPVQPAYLGPLAQRRPDAAASD
jgi:DNA-binding response OmpR family regulator